MNSIRREILIWMLLGFILVAFASSIGSYWLVRSRVNGIYRDEVQIIASALAHKLPGPDTSSPSQNPDRGGSGIIARVTDKAGTRVYATPGTKGVPPSQQPAYTNVPDGAGWWHIYKQTAADREVLVAQYVRRAKDAAAFAALEVSLWSLVLIPLLSGLLLFVIRRTFEPLHEVGLAIVHLDLNRLDSLSTDRVPKEIGSLVEAINVLMGRLRQSHEMQRQFTSDVAHELRMPLAAVQLELHNLQEKASNPEAIQALGRLEARINRASRLIAQLLSLARHNETDTGTIFEPIDAVALVRECIAEVLPLADKKGIDLGMRSAMEAQIWGVPGALRTLFINLLDNAIQYSPVHGVVDASLQLKGDRLVVGIEDNGAGIPEHLLERVFERFFRIASSEGVGSGLGLAIVRTIAERHGATVRLENRCGGGILAEVVFPVVGGTTPSSNRQQHGPKSTA